MDEIVEVWKDIEKYEDKYQVSSLGKIKSLERRLYNGNGDYILSTKILKKRTNPQGYKTISLCKNGKPKSFRVNRLVAIAYIPNPLNLKEVNHKDYDKSNNAVNNLEWMTPKDNNRHGTKSPLFIRAKEILKERREQLKLK